MLRFRRRLFLAWVVVSALFPLTLSPVRLAIFVCAASASAIGFLIGSKSSIPRWAWNCGVGVIVVGVAGTALGWLKQNPGASDLARPFVVWPAMFFLFLHGRGGADDVRVLARVLDVLTVVVAGLTTALSLGLPGSSLLRSEIFGVVSAAEYSGFRQVSFAPTVSLIFLTPYALVRAIKAGASARRRVPAGAVAGMCLLASLLAGQRSLFLAIMLGAAIALGGSRLQRRSPRRPSPTARVRSTQLAGGTFALGLAAASVALFPSLRLPTKIVARVWESSVQADEVRRAQASALINSWSESPLVGHGLGATVDGVVRNVDAPWQFELLHHLVLNSVGLFGFCVLLACFLKVMLQLVRNAGFDPSTVLGVLAGFIAACVASTFNPVISKLGTMWMIFVPIYIAIASDSVAVGRTRRRGGHAISTRLPQVRSEMGGS